MKPHLQPERFIAEGLVAASLGSACVAVLYSAWWRSCCESATTFVSIVFLPGMVIGMLIGGGVHSATRYHYYVGAAIEVFLVWVGTRLVLAARRRQKAARTDDA